MPTSAEKSDLGFLRKTGTTVTYTCTITVSNLKSISCFVLTLSSQQIGNQADRRKRGTMFSLFRGHEAWKNVKIYECVLFRIEIILPSYVGIKIYFKDVPKY